jgi:hypothetical protein
MPTTTEVEARLRRTAQACEPLVEDLLGDPPTPVVVARRRPPARPWLLAAALLVVAALAGLAVVAAQDDPAGDVHADGGAPTTDPGPPAEGTPLTTGLAVLLPDGTRVVLGLSDPDRWTPGEAEVTAELDGLDTPLTITLTPRTATEIRDDMTAVIRFEELGDGVYRLDQRQEGYLVVERDGWSAVALVSAEEAPALPLPEDVISSLAESLSFTVGPGGPTVVAGPGLTVTQAVRWLEADVPEGDEASQLQVSVGDDPETCTDPTRVVRCEDGLRVVAWGEPAEAVFPDVTVMRTPEPETSPVPAETVVPVALADGTTAELWVPATTVWTVRETHARVTFAGSGDSHIVRFIREDAATWASQVGMEAVPVEGEGVYDVTRGDDRWLLVEDDGWTAVLAVAGEEATSRLDDDLIARLGRELAFTPTEAGPTDLTGPLEVIGVGAELRPEPATDDPADVLLVQAGVVVPDVCGGPANPQNRCFVDDRLVLTGLGSGGQAALAAMTVTLDG